jgi:hypothetical protein
VRLREATTQVRSRILRSVVRAPHPYAPKLTRSSHRHFFPISIILRAHCFPLRKSWYPHSRCEVFQSRSRRLGPISLTKVFTGSPNSFEPEFQRHQPPAVLKPVNFSGALHTIGCKSEASDDVDWLVYLHHVLSAQWWPHWFLICERCMCREPTSSKLTMIYDAREQGKRTIEVLSDVWFSRFGWVFVFRIAGS